MTDAEIESMVKDWADAIKSQDFVYANFLRIELIKHGVTKLFYNMSSGAIIWGKV